MKTGSFYVKTLISGREFNWDTWHFFHTWSRYLIWARFLSLSSAAHVDFLPCWQSKISFHIWYNVPWSAYSRSAPKCLAVSVTLSSGLHFPGWRSTRDLQVRVGSSHLMKTSDLIDQIVVFYLSLTRWNVWNHAVSCDWPCWKVWLFSDLQD